MSHNHDDPGGTLHVREIYTTLYNEIVQPDKVFVATQYFRRKWVPLLGPSLAWLVIALRQHCYWNRQSGERRSWCLVTQEDLAAQIGVTKATVRRLLKHEYAGHFIVDVSHRYRYDANLGKQVRKQSLYQVRMDDPLLPEDETLLKEQIAARLDGRSTDPETGQIDVLALLDHLSAPDQDTLPAPGQSPLAAVAGLAEGQAEEKTGEGREAASGREHGESLSYASAVVVPAAQLAGWKLAPDCVLVAWQDGYLAVSLAEVIKRDLSQGGTLWGEATRTKCYYSVSHALGEGWEKWLPEEERRLALESQLVAELQEQHRRLGAFSLEEALGRYFTAQLVEDLLRGRSPSDRLRIEAWVTYVRRNENLKNPGGFLRTRIESAEHPPDP